MRERIAKVIDPEAFAATGAGAGRIYTAAELEHRRALALDKADQILVLDFSFEELPPDLQDTVDVLEAAVIASCRGKA
ncbi:MAG: hypothetical protein QOH47_844 [Sphingomonadales bacterium]|jgi:hypothetical protein|nr:hypothetical protein [Sphingomonadales bacterium]